MRTYNAIREQVVALLLALAITVCFAVGSRSAQEQKASAQDAAVPAKTSSQTDKSSGQPNSQKTSANPADKKPFDLSRLPRVSTEAAARDAARKATEKTNADDSANSSTDDDVTELRPATKQDTKDTGTVVAEPQKDKNPYKIHGRVEGSAGSGQVRSSSVGGAVGGSSRSGKTAIYVESDKGRTEVRPR